MAAWPSRMAISLSGPNVMDDPVGNCPGPDSMVNVTSGELLIGRPPASTTVATTCTSSSESVPGMTVLSAVNRNPAGVPRAGHGDGGMWRYSLRYQYH